MIAIRVEWGGARLPVRIDVSGPTLASACDGLGGALAEAFAGQPVGSSLTSRMWRAADSEDGTVHLVLEGEVTRPAPDNGEDENGVDEDEAPCPGNGKCHGALRWCNACGDVARVCDGLVCTSHPRCEECRAISVDPDDQDGVIITKQCASCGYCPHVRREGTFGKPLTRVCPGCGDGRYDDEPGRCNACGLACPPAYPRHRPQCPTSLAIRVCETCGAGIREGAAHVERRWSAPGQPDVLAWYHPNCNRPATKRSFGIKYSGTTEVHYAAKPSPPPPPTAVEKGEAIDSRPLSSLETVAMLALVSLRRAALDGTAGRAEMRERQAHVDVAMAGLTQAERQRAHAKYRAIVEAEEAVAAAERGDTPLAAATTTTSTVVEKGDTPPSAAARDHEALLRAVHREIDAGTPAEHFAHWRAALAASYGQLTPAERTRMCALDAGLANARRRTGKTPIVPVDDAAGPACVVCHEPAPSSPAGLGPHVGCAREISSQPAPPAAPSPPPACPWCCGNGWLWKGPLEGTRAIGACSKCRRFESDAAALSDYQNGVKRTCPRCNSTGWVSVPDDRPGSEAEPGSHIIVRCKREGCIAGVHMGTDAAARDAFTRFLEATGQLPLMDVDDEEEDPPPPGRVHMLRRKHDGFTITPVTYCGLTVDAPGWGASDSNMVDRARFAEVTCEACLAARACAACNDTHRVEGEDKTVLCTRCPSPCDACRRGLQPFCALVPCPCACHTKAAPKAPGRMVPRQAAAGEPTAKERSTS